MMRKGKGLSVRIRVGTLAVVLVLLLAACAPATPGSPTQTSSASEGATAGPTPSESAAPSPSPSPSEAGTTTATPVAGFSLSSIRMVSPTAGWALDENAFHLYHTTDGGVSWQDVTPAQASGAVSSLEVLNEQTAWAGFTQYEQGTLMIFATTDGGKTWKDAVFRAATAKTAGASPPSGGWLQFLDITHGWLLVSYGAFAGSEWVELYRSDNGGASWTRVASGGPDDKAPNGLPFGGDKTGVGFADGRNGWLTGHQNAESGEYLYVTHDGGKTWHWVDLPVPATYAKAASMFTYPPTFFTPQEGVLPAVFGGGGYHPALLFYRTRDGGDTWQATTLLPGAQTFHGYQWSVLDGNHLIASDGAQIYVSSDEGQTWKTVEPDAKLAPLAQLDFVSPEVGWALVGDLQVDELLQLWKTTDGGRHWSALP